MPLLKSAAPHCSKSAAVPDMHMPRSQDNLHLHLRLVHCQLAGHHWHRLSQQLSYSFVHSSLFVLEWFCLFAFIYEYQGRLLQARARQGSRCPGQCARRSTGMRMGTQPPRAQWKYLPRADHPLQTTSRDTEPARTQNPPSGGPSKNTTMLLCSRTHLCCLTDLPWPQRTIARLAPSRPRPNSRIMGTWACVASALIPAAALFNCIAFNWPHALCSYPRPHRQLHHGGPISVANCNALYHR